MTDERECRETVAMPGWCCVHWAWLHPRPESEPPRPARGLRPDVAWRWGKWTFGLWTDAGNHTILGIDVGPLEVVWRREGYRP